MTKHSYIQRRLLLAAIALVLWASCTTPAGYTAFELMPTEEWHRDSILRFELPVEDTARSYNLVLDVRSSTDYRFQNLYLFIDIEAPNGATLRDTLECFLADDAGRWLGSGHGALRDNRYMYREGARFAMQGAYCLSIQQAMRMEALKGVVGVGIRMEEAPQK